MYVTTRFVGVQRGGVKYLVFLLTEEYIESCQKIAQDIAPALERFGRDLGESGAIVRPFAGSEQTTLSELMNKKKWGEEVVRRIRGGLPGLLITSVDFDEFDPRASQYALILLRDLIDDKGNVEIFEIEKLLSALLKGAKEDRIFDAADEFLIQRQDQKMKEAVEIKAKFGWISMDLKKGLKIWDSRHRDVKY